MCDSKARGLEKTDEKVERVMWPRLVGSSDLYTIWSSGSLSCAPVGKVAASAAFNPLASSLTDVDADGRAPAV